MAFHWCGHSADFPVERVKFGAELSGDEIPSPLLLLLLRLNRESAAKKDIFRAPGNTQQCKSLMRALKTGQLLNLEAYSLHTIASVIKLFFRQIPNGVFQSRDNELELCAAIEAKSVDECRDRMRHVIHRLPLVSQRLLTLMFGTLRSCTVQTPPESLGVSVAPSFIRCFADATTKNDVTCVKAQISKATAVVTFLIEHFGVSNLFGPSNYEYYARISGRVLCVDEDWLFAFRYPPDSVVPRKTSLKIENEWLRTEQHRWNLNNDSLALFNNEQLKHVNQYAESTKSLTYLPIVHERQTQRMKTRSEWFLKKEHVTEEQCSELSERALHVTCTYN